MIHAVTITELAEKLGDLPLGRGVDVYLHFNTDGLNKQEIEELLKDDSIGNDYLVGAFSIAKMSFLDSEMYVVGGYLNPTSTGWILDEADYDYNLAKNTICTFLNAMSEPLDEKNGEPIVYLTDRAYELSIEQNYLTASKYN